MTKFFLCIMVAAAITCAGAIGINSFSRSENDYSSLLIQNIEALTEDNDLQKLDCSYTPVPQPCSASISGEVAAKLLGLKVGSISGDVEVPIVGAQECRGNGDMTCRPVRCDELINALR